MIVYGQISCICLHANEGRECKTKHRHRHGIGNLHHFHILTFRLNQMYWGNFLAYNVKETLPSTDSTLLETLVN